MPGFTINHVSLSGNLTRDPELRALPSGTSLCQLRIAVNERVKSNDQWTDRANYFDVTVWGGIGESVAKQLAKGDGIAVAGRLHWREWQDQQGNKRQTVDVTADSVVPIPRNGSNRGNGRREDSDVPIDTGDFDRSPMANAGGPPGADDDIPF
jgi:single-strand DNA-binding protein